MNITIENNQDAQRFESLIEGHRCELNYVQHDHVMTMNRVYVPPALEGRGIAGQLTQFALDYCRQHELSVVPRCPYVAHWIQRHPEYQSLADQSE